MAALSGHARRNRAYWTEQAADYAERGRRSWGGEPQWGIWHIPERELGVLDDVAGLDTLELGCGTAYWSAWLARAGARPVGLDVTPAQLETARTLQAEVGLDFPLVEASAEEVPLPDESFDLVLSEYGASTWCDPYRWIPEAARLLRPGGRLVFLVNGWLATLTWPDAPEPATTALQRPHFRPRATEWSFEEGVSFHLPHGEWIELLRANGLDVEALFELRAPENAGPDEFGIATPEWARSWPSEEIWKARKRER